MHVVETVAVVIAGPMVAVEIAADAVGITVLRRVLPYWDLVSLVALPVAAVVTGKLLIAAAAVAMAAAVLVTVLSKGRGEPVRLARVLLLLAVVVLLTTALA